jgi:hypothetical protein
MTIIGGTSQPMRCTAAKTSPVLGASGRRAMKTPLEMLLDQVGKQVVKEHQYFHLEKDEMPVNITVDGLDLQVIGMEEDGTLLCLEVPKEKP